MATVTTNNSYYTAIAQALRAKTGGTETYKPSEMAAGIAALSSGAELNYSIVTSTTQPSAPEENTMWIKTATTPPTVYIQCEKSTSPANGTIWISQGVQSHVPIMPISGQNLYIYPLTAKQYNSTLNQWSTLEAVTYKNGAWVNWNVHLYDTGNTYSAYTGGWTTQARGINATMQGVTGTLTLDEGSMYLSASNVISNNGSGTQLITAKPIDLTPYSTLNIEFSSVSGVAYISTIAALNDTISTGASTQLTNSSTTTKKTATLDVSAINESRYIVCPVYTYYSGTTVLPLTLRVYRVWLT